MTELVIGSVIAVLGFLVLVVPSLRTRKVAAGVARWSERFGLTVTDDVRPFLMRRRRSTWIGNGVGVTVGIELGSMIQLAVPDVRSSLLESMALQQGSLLLGGLGAVVGGAIASSLTTPTGPRVARARRVTVADYVDPVERAVPPVVAAVAAAVGAVPLLRGASASSAWAAAGAGIGALLVVATAEGIALLLVTRPQHAANPHQLAWADALRAETVRGALSVGAALAAASLLGSVPPALSALGLHADPGEVRLGLVYGLLAVLLVSWIRTMLSGPARYFLQRLWPAVAAELAEHARSIEEVSR